MGLQIFPETLVRIRLQLWVNLLCELTIVLLLANIIRNDRLN